jgi:gamma-glutamylaminecyclotransferase
VNAISDEHGVAPLSHTLLPGHANVFVFGTLKAGFALHERGLAAATFDGCWRTIMPYPMLVAGPWYAPMMFDEPGVGQRVSGELYEVDRRALAVLDALESIGVPGNDRIFIEIERLDGEERCVAFVYVKSRAFATPAHTGYLADYQDRRFVLPELRACSP